MELFANIVIDWKLLTIFENSYRLDLWLGSEYASGMSKIKFNLKVKVTLYTKWLEKVNA